MNAPAIDTYLPALRGDVSAVAVPESAIVAKIREYLMAVRAHLSELHRSGAQGAVVNAANSDAIDRLVRRIFENIEHECYAQVPQLESRMSVIAVGGYGRREMSIYSDVDLLLLYTGELTDYIRNIAERMQRQLWDAGFVVGCALRTLAETVEIGKTEATVPTALLDARFIVGNVALFHDLVEAVRREIVSDALCFIRQRKDDAKLRHQKYGDSLYLLQPNLKEGAGGLRDYHNAYWIARVTFPALKGFDDFLHFGLLTERELQEMRAALDFHWRVRNELHFMAKRKNDEMSFNLQEKIATNFGYEKLAVGEDELPVEKFMGDYYRSARAISSYALLVIGQCQRKARASEQELAVREIEHGFRIVEGQIEIPHAALLREKPIRLFLVFELAQQYDVRLSRTAQRFVRENLDLVDDHFRTDPGAGEAFLRILASEKRVMRTIMTMNEIGLIARYIPEWEHVVCLWQQVIYHSYTVDVHSIFLIEELRRLWKRKYVHQVPDLTELIQHVKDFSVLFLGCLFHDIGKGLGGDHSIKGAVLTKDFLTRIGFDAERAQRVIFLVEQHLVMSHLAQRRDLSDPRLVVDFARIVGDRENLRNLYLLTFADIRASSPAAWTAWKGHLLRELYERTSEYLETGEGDPARAIEQAESRIDRVIDASRLELRAAGMGEEKIQAFFEGMPRRYFISHTPREIARHALVVLSFRKDQVVTTSVRSLGGGSTEFILCTRDQPKVYSKVAGVLALKGLNILASNVYSSRDGLALEIYRLDTPRGGEEEHRLLWASTENALHAVLAGGVSVEELMRKVSRRPVARPSSRHKPDVTVSNDESDFYTIVEVRADDRIGLLYDLTRTIADVGLEVYISKASTALDQVTDTFYLKERDGRKMSDPTRMELLRTRLMSVIGGESWASATQK